MEDIKDATQEGVSNVNEISSDEHNQSRVISQREQAIAAIDEQVSKMREEEQGVSVQKDTQFVNNSVPNEIDQGERQIKVKIDGEELYVPESEIIRNYQKTSAADKRLEQAAIERQKLEEEKRIFEESKKNQAEIPEENIQNADELEDTTRRIFEEITEGNIDSATKLLADTLKTFKKGEASADIDKGKISQIFQELNNEKEMRQNYQQAKEMFDRDYGFINENPRMTQLANLVFNESIEAGKLPTEAARVAGEEVKKMLNFTNNNQTADRQVRKQFIDNIPNANATTISSSNMTSDDDPRAIIEQMKRSRGQA